MSAVAAERPAQAPIKLLHAPPPGVMAPVVASMVSGVKQRSDEPEYLSKSCGRSGPAIGARFTYTTPESGVSISFSRSIWIQEIREIESQRVLVTAEVTGAFATEDGRPARTPAAFRDKLAPLCVPDDTAPRT